MTDYKDATFMQRHEDLDKILKYFAQRAINIWKVTNSSDVVIAFNSITGAITVNTTNANDGDKYLAEAYCDNSETIMNVIYEKNSFTGKFDVYLNGIKDNGATIDTYGASSSAANSEITLSTKPMKGYNRIELRVNGKNASSSDYVLRIYQISLY
jgi:hypothetical protein